MYAQVAQPGTRPESAARDLRTKSPLPPVVSRPLTEAPGFPESRAVRSPPSPFSSIHPSHAPARRDYRLSRLPHLLSRQPSPPFIRFLSIPFWYQVPALTPIHRSHPPPKLRPPKTPNHRASYRQGLPQALFRQYLPAPIAPSRSCHPHRASPPVPFRARPGLVTKWSL